MIETLSLLLALAAGVLLGSIFFGGLWWTVRKGFSSNKPALWFFGSVVLRTGITLAGFYFASGADWKQLLVCLLGFIIARLVVTKLTAMPMVKRAGVNETGVKEASHAS